jgi:hypothetical protein
MCKGLTPVWLHTILETCPRQVEECTHSGGKSMTRFKRSPARLRVKDEVVRLRANGARKELWRAGAEEDGMQLSEWIRHLADQRLAELTRRPDDSRRTA